MSTVHFQLKSMSAQPQLATRGPFGETGLSVPTLVYGTSFMGNLYHELPEEVKLQIMQQWFEVSASARIPGRQIPPSATGTTAPGRNT